MDDRAAGAWAVVLAGGEGLRLRSVTRAIVGDDRPKQYVPLISGDSDLGTPQRLFKLLQALGITPPWMRGRRPAGGQGCPASPVNRGNAA